VAKNKGKYNKDKPEPAPQQQLLSMTERAFAYVRPHSTKIAAVAGGVVVALAAFSIYTHFKEKGLAEGTYAYDQAMRVVTRPVDELPQIGRVPEPDETKFKTVAERSEAAAAALAKLEADRGASGPVAQGLLPLATSYYDTGKFDESIQTYLKYLAATSDPGLRAMAEQGLGQAYEAKALAQKEAGPRNAGLDQALFAYAEIDKTERGPFSGLSLYHQGRIQALKGDAAKAAELFKKALDKPLLESIKLDIQSRLPLVETK
jgi:predicted negative regulator of RcsB-dependent stress response